MRKLILSVAPVSANSKKMDPRAVADDVIRSVVEGASIVHLHVRDENAKLTNDLTVLKKTVEMILSESDVIIQVSTGGVSQLTIEERCAPLYYNKVEMASLNVGSINLGEGVFKNPIKDVRYCVEQILKQNILPETEVFEIGMIHTTIELSHEMNFKKPVLYNIVLGHKGGAPATIEALTALRSFIPSDALWGITHYGRKNFDLLMTAVLMGASLVRIGFEDSDALDETTTACCNAAIVAKLAHIIRTCGLEIATPEQAREILMVKNK